MYVVDITRDFNNTDILCGNDSMDAKTKTINYIMDYALANLNLSIDRDLLDQNLNMGQFSLNKFLKEFYSLMADNDLLIQSIPVDKNHCLFLKYKDDKSDFPMLYSFQKKEMKYAQSLMRFLVNDSLIEKCQDDLDKYENIKMTNKYNILDSVYPQYGINCKIISLYNGGLFLEELLNNSCSLNQLQKNNFGRYDI